MQIREYLQSHTLLFDGATGTLLCPDGETSCETLCLSDPERVLRAHQQYLLGGARAIKTNTFRAHALPQRAEIAGAAWQIACRAAAPFDALVFADIGPLDAQEETAGQECLNMVDQFLSLGARHFLFETFAEARPIMDLAARVRAACPQAFIIGSIAARPEGYTRTGADARALLRQLDACPHVDAVGFNCVAGPHHLLKLINQLPPLEKPLSVMPNSGYPTQLDGRVYYSSGAEYFAAQLAKIARRARIVGGCCGTTPEFIRLAAARIAREGGPKSAPAAPAAPARETPAAAAQSAFYQKLAAGKRVFAVELDSPAGGDARKFMENARYLCQAGADAITIADCPVARVRSDSCMLAAKLRRELGVEAIPHMTCRDRNLNATRALLMGLSIEDVRNVLVVTGDPIPSDLAGQVKAVYNFNSVMLARHIAQMGAGFLICGALNVNAANFRAELDKALRKREAGVSAFFTQPIFDQEAADNLRAARERMPDAYLLGGIMPVVSEKNARFLQNEVSGVRISDQLAARYAGLDRASAEALARAIALKTARAIDRYVDGYYLMTPFGRVSLIEAVMRDIAGLKSAPGEKN